MSSHNFIYDYGEECNFVISFLLAVTQSSAISAPIVKSRTIHRTYHSTWMFEDIMEKE